MNDQAVRVAALLQEAGATHHLVYRIVDGDDPNWASWYAQWLPGPEARYDQREALGLAFVAGLQHLQPQQRAVLVLRDVLGFRASEAAAILDTSQAAVNSLLQRARLALEGRLPAARRDRAPLPNSPHEREVVGQFADALEDGDIGAVVALLTDDAWLTMPPYPYQYQGAAIESAPMYRPPIAVAKRSSSSGSSFSATWPRMWMNA